MENKKTKKKPKIVKKPFLTGSPVDGTTAKAALTFFGGMLLMLLAYLLLCSMMLWDSLSPMVWSWWLCMRCSS